MYSLLISPHVEVNEDSKLNTLSPLIPHSVLFDRNWNKYDIRTK